MRGSFAPIYVSNDGGNKWTLNSIVLWMFDEFPNIRYFIDIHSYSEDILYNWGDDWNQAAGPGMNFQNAAYNGKRSIAGDAAYKEAKIYSYTIEWGSPDNPTPFHPPCLNGISS